MEKVEKTRRFALCGVALSAMTLVLPLSVAQAQSGPNAAPQASSGGSEGGGEIVVTAQRRAEALKDVPISVQALTGETLARQSIQSTADLASVAPTVNFTSVHSAAATAFSLRGVSSLAPQLGVQPSTAMVVDGVVLFQQGEFVTELADIERIEILNGPQGTLFGKNSTAGVINIVTKRPVDRFEGRIEGLATTDEEYSIRGVLNAPLGDQARLRLTGYYGDQSPLIKNSSGRGGAGLEAYGVNAKLEFDLSDDLTFLLNGTYSRRESTYGTFLLIGPSVFSPFQQTLNGVPLGRGVKEVNIDQPNVAIAKTRSLSGTFEWNLSDQWSLVSISNYSKFTEVSSVDADGTPAGNNLGVGDTMPGNPYPFQTVFPGMDKRFPVEFKYFSQEIRANYDSDFMRVVIGAYYQDTRGFNRNDLPFNFDGVVLGAIPGQRYYVNNLTVFRIKDRTASIFGDVTVPLNDQWKVFAGVRYTHEKIDGVYHREDYFAPFALYDHTTGTVNAAPVNIVDDRESKTVNNLSGRAGVQFEPDRNLNFYASYARGYKAPAVAGGTSHNPATGDFIIKPEIADAFEVGAKLRLFDGRVALNAALFYETIDDIQLGTILPGSTNFAPFLLNAGKLKTRGFEGDMSWSVTPALKLTAALAYNKATYSGFSFLCNPTQLRTGTCPNPVPGSSPPTGTQDITGNQVIGAPRWKYSLGANYDTELSDTGWSIFANASWTWTDKVQYGLDNDPLRLEPSHGMLNASIGFRSPGDRYEVQIFGKNLTNDFYYTHLVDVVSIAQPLGYVGRDIERYGGVKLTMRF